MVTHVETPLSPTRILCQQMLSIFKRHLIDMAQALSPQSSQSQRDRKLYCIIHNGHVEKQIG